MCDEHDQNRGEAVLPRPPPPLPAFLWPDPQCGSLASASPGVGSRKPAASPTPHLPIAMVTLISTELVRALSLFAGESWLQAPNDCAVLLGTEVSGRGPGAQRRQRREGGPLQALARAPWAGRAAARGDGPFLPGRNQQPPVHLLSWSSTKVIRSLAYGWLFMCPSHSLSVQVTVPGASWPRPLL